MAELWRYPQEADPLKRPRNDDFAGGAYGAMPWRDAGVGAAQGYAQNGQVAYGGPGLPRPDLSIHPGASGMAGLRGLPSARGGGADSYLGGRLGLIDTGLVKPSLGLNGAPPEAGVRVGSGAPSPHDTTPTLFVEGVPADCTKREAAHIFRPFIGFKEVRLVRKESKRPGGDPLNLCFVDFTDARYAAIALEALQGYKFDEADPNCYALRLQFARSSGPRTARDYDDANRLRGPRH